MSYTTLCKQKESDNACADPEHFIIGGPTLTFVCFCCFIFHLMRGGMVQIAL